jgi:isochorismate pyruvate lyase
MKTPADCSSMDDIRAEIDRIDRALIDLFAERACYIDRAASVKAEVGLPARITNRVEEVVSNVRGHAAARGINPDLAEKLWRKLIEWSITREEDALGKD